MRIALLTDGIYPFILGGMQKHSYYLAKYLAQHKVYVDLYYSVSYNDVLPISLKEISDEELPFLESHVIHFPKLADYPGHYLSESYKYSKLLFYLLIKQPRPDLIYVQGFSGWYLLNHRKRLANIPVVFNFHGLEMFQTAPTLKVWLQQVLLRPATRINLKRADYVISLGGDLTPILQRFNNSVVEMPIGIEESWLNDSKSNNQIIKFAFIGRYERRKGIEELHKAIDLLPCGLPFEFNFIGPIKLSQQIEHSKVIYHGPIREQERVKALLEQMDVLVVPSWSEGMPTVILEAMACGCAVLATKVGAVSVLIDERNGWLIEPGDIQQLTNQLKDILEMDRQLLDAKKQQSLEKVKAFTWENIITDHLWLFQSIIQKNKV